MYYNFYYFFTFEVICSVAIKSARIKIMSIEPINIKNVRTKALLTWSRKRALFQLQFWKSTSYEPKIGAEKGPCLSSCQQGIRAIWSSAYHTHYRDSNCVPQS